MKWEKIGKIFDPTEHKLINGCKEFAQTPQALVFDNFVRIYFSTRQVEENGKHLSNIAYVDFTKDFTSIIKISNHEVIKFGNLGCYDEHGIFPLNVLRHKKQIYGYIGGWNRRYSVLVDGAIGVAISHDNGETFQRIGDGPVLAPTFNEPFLIADPFVQIFDNVFHMWYIFGEKWVKFKENEKPERIYKIAHAISNDGVNWKREGKFIIENNLLEEECQALPTVIKINDTYHMYFCYRYASDFRLNKDRGYRIGYAYSYDMRTWIRDDSNSGIEKTSLSWDSDMMCYPHIFQCDNNIYLLYNGNEFGKYCFGIAKLIN